MADEPNPFDSYAGDATTLPPPGDTPPAPQGKAPDNGPNPFDAFQDDSTDTLKDAPPPTPAESFVENLKQGAGGLTKQALQTTTHDRLMKTIREGNEKGIARPEEGFQTEKVAQPEYDKALGDLAVMDANRHRWDRFQSEGFWGKTAAFVGGAVGGILDPVNLLPLGATVNSIRGIAAATGAGEVISKIAANAGAFGLFSAGTDAVSQGLDIETGYQVGFDGQRTVMAGALGTALGGSLTAIGTLIKGLKGELPHQAPKALEGAAKDRELARLGEEERMRAADEAAAPPEPALAAAPEPPTAPVEPPPPPPEHGFKDLVDDHKEKLGPEAPPEQAAHEAFHEEVGDPLEAAMREGGIDPSHLPEIQEHYSRAPGESVDAATHRALDDWIDGQVQAQKAIETKDPALRHDLEQAEAPAAREKPPEGWEPHPDVLAEARRLSRGWSPRPEGQKPKSLNAFVRDNGGLRNDQPEAADLLAQDIGRQPGLLRSKDAGGLDVTEMAERARDRGYDLGPDLATGNGVNSERFFEMFKEDVTGRQKHYPAGAETEAHAETKRYNDETSNHLRNRLGVNPKGMDPRQIAWLLEGGHERTSGRLSEEGGGVSGGRAAQPGEGQGTLGLGAEPPVRGGGGGERVARGEAGPAAAARAESGQTIDLPQAHEELVALVKQSITTDPIRLVLRKGDSTILLSRNLAEDAPYRLTFFDQDGPVRHIEYNEASGLTGIGGMAQALGDARQEGFKLEKPGPAAAAAADRGERISPDERRGSTQAPVGEAGGDQAAGAQGGNTPAAKLEGVGPVADTRGAGVQYHGTGDADLKPDSGHYSSLNYYGQGFYTTDATDIAGGYARSKRNRSGTPSLYKVEETHPLKILDGEQPFPDEVRKVLEPVGDHNGEPIGQLINDAYGEGASPKNLRELYDRLRDDGSAEGYNADTIQEVFDAINTALRELGYNGISHQGGLRTKKAPHRVVIYFDPEKDVRVVKDKWPDGQAAKEPAQRAPAEKPPEQAVAAEASPPVEPPNLSAKEINALAARMPKDEADEFNLLWAMGANKGESAARDTARFVELVDKYGEKPLATEHTAQGEQTLMPGVEPVSDRQRAEAGMQKPMRGGQEAPGGMFDEGALAQHEMFLRRMGAKPQGPAAETRRHANREQLPGEAETIVGPREAVTDAEARDLKLNEQMKHITERMGRRLEFDNRFTVGGVLGTYKPKEGVLRAKYAGDVEVWSHELGHAIDQDLATNPNTKAAWSALRTAAPNELLPLDFNAVRSGGSPSIEEGVAEFLRMYITNPAYAAKQVPLTYGAFKGILNKTPNLASILEDAAKMAHTESGLNPTQVFTTMIAQPHVEGLEKMSRSVARYGIVPTIRDYAARAYASVIRENVNFDRFSQALRDAGFQKEGKPLADLTYAKDPDHLYRQMDGARQSAVSIIDRGVPLNLTDPFNAPRSPSLNGAFARAFNGSYSRIENPTDPLVKAFDGYLVARRAIGEWDLFEAGELRNQPVRASRAETEGAISNFETMYPNFKPAADDFFAFQRAYTQRMVDKGLWSQEMADAFIAKRSDHIPLYRDFGEDKAGGGARNTKGGGLQFSDVHAFMGSTRDVVSPSRSVMQDVARRERRIAENEVWTALDDLARRAGEVAGPLWEHVPNTEVKGTTIDVEDALRALGKEKGLSPAEIDMMIADLPPMIGQDMTATIFSRNDTTPRGERVAFFYRGGKRQTVKMGDNELSKQFFDLMSGMSAPEKDLFLGGVQAVNAAFQASITHAPRFLIGTLVRDNITRMFFPRAQGVLGRVPFAQDLSGIYTMMFDRSFYRAYQEQGGIRGGAYSHAAGEINHDTFKAAASASGMMGRTLDELAAANTFGAKAATIATIPANLVKTTAEYAGSLVNRVRYKEGLPAQGWAVLTTPFKMVSDSLKLMEMGETASRVGNAKLTYNYLKGQGLSDVEAMAGGMYEACDVLNYNSRGKMMTAMPRIFPFLQAAITGADRSARGLIAEPIAAASRAMERGGYANLDPKDKQVLAAAWKNWAMIGAVSGVGASMYLPYAQDTEFYKRSSKYMRETYWLIQTGEDDEGRPVGLSIHKGYDVSAAIINTIENFSEEARKHDPINWLHVMSGLKEAVPRQFRSTTGLLEAAPGVRTAYEVQTGKKLGFEGGPARPLIPGSMEGLPPDRQVLATTSTFARNMGREMGVSPIVIDHVFNSSGTGVQDVRDLSSAIFDNNPLLTTKDALNRFFFGQVYRTSRGDAGAGQDLRDVMARNTGDYQKQSNAYKMSLEAGDTAEANSVYNRADDAAKTLMTLQSSVRFDPDARALHPLVRSQAIADNVYSMMRDLGKNQILIQDKAHRRGEPRKVIDLSNEQTRQVHAQLNGLLSEETRNGLTIAGHPGYEDFSIVDTKPRIEILRNISPEVAKEYEARMKTGHVLPAQGVANQWPETKRRLLQDQRAARLSDLIAGAKRP